jgi:rod shape-determining protein MreD
MHLIIAAAAAVAAALAEVTVVQYLRIGDAVPHPVLVLGVVWVIAGGLEAGLALAFVGGLALDILLQRPLGSSAFAALIAIAGASLVGGLLSRSRVVAPVIATMIASPAYSMLLLLATTALTAVPLSDPALRSIVPSGLYDTALAVVVGPLAVAIVLRRRDAERVDW